MGLHRWYAYCAEKTLRGRRAPRQGKNITEIVLINGIGGPQLGLWSVT